MPVSGLITILLVDFALTLWHAYQECKGPGSPLWRNFGAIVGLEIPNRLGFLGFTIGLTLIPFAVGFVAIIGPLSGFWTALALGALIGARLSDTLVSHVVLYGIGYRPNPGLPSTPFYVVEAAFLAWFFAAPLAAEPFAEKLGLVFGAGAFVIVLPSLWLARLAFPQARRPPWTRGQPMPAWAAIAHKPE